MEKIDKKKRFLKCLAILAQPFTLHIPTQGLQLIAQGSIYAIADSAIAKEYNYSDIEEVLNKYNEYVKLAVLEIIDNYKTDEIISDFSGKYFSSEQKARYLVNMWSERYPNQYSENDKNQISTALAEYFICVRNTILQDPNSVRMILDLFGESFNDVNVKIQEIQRVIKNLERDIQISNYSKENGISRNIHIDNERYVDSFKETLFLHKNQELKEVNLLNLFILQKYNVLYDPFEQHRIHVEGVTQPALSEFLGETIEFINSDNYRDSIIIIEGDAGCGKTSLVAWMNYHYSINDDIAHMLFMGRPLITIRLRDLDREDIIANYDLLYAIRKYMNAESLDDIEKRFPEAVVILDGFDELCMIDGVVIESEKLLYNILRKGLNGYSFIITTRPKYIDYSQLELNIVAISLNHFDKPQRMQWLERFSSKKYCGQIIDKEVENYILSIKDDRTSCICDTPMTLYMLSSQHGLTKYLDNSWALYHCIFHESLSETEYNKMFPNADRIYNHGIEKIKDTIYRISEEIAFRMFKRENKVFYISSGEIIEIIKELSVEIPLLENAAVRSVAEHCYALCCYWKANYDHGVVEFYHNNIRDFFLAERICRKLDNYADEMNKSNDKSNEKNCKQLADLICEMFSYGILQTRTLEFIILRLKFQKSSFAIFAYRNKLITDTLLYLSREGISYSNVLRENSVINPIKMIENIIACLVHTIRCIYEDQLAESEVIPWIPKTFYANHILMDTFKYCFCRAPINLTANENISFGSRGRFSGMDFSGYDLRNIGFEHSEMMNMKFKNTLLSKSNFSNAILSGSDFSNADVSFANFKNANLSKCNFSNTNLIGTVLPDGYMSTSQDEQVVHLRSMCINELKLKPTLGEISQFLINSCVEMKKKFVTDSITLPKIKMFKEKTIESITSFGFVPVSEMFGSDASVYYNDRMYAGIDFIRGEDINLEHIINFKRLLDTVSSWNESSRLFFLIFESGEMKNYLHLKNDLIEYSSNLYIEKREYYELSELNTGCDYIKHLVLKYDCKGVSSIHYITMYYRT